MSQWASPPLGRDLPEYFYNLPFPPSRRVLGVNVWRSWHFNLGLCNTRYYSIWYDKLNQNRKEVWVWLGLTSHMFVRRRDEMQMMKWWNLITTSSQVATNEIHSPNKKLSSISFQINEVTNYQLDICWRWRCRTRGLIDLKLMSFMIESAVMNCLVQLAFTKEDQPSIHAKSFFLCVL